MDPVTTRPAPCAGLRIGDIARVQIFSAVLATALGLLALWAWGLAGIVAYVIAAPLASFILSQMYVARLPRVQAPRSDLAELSAQWHALRRARAGVPQPYCNGAAIAAR